MSRFFNGVTTIVPKHENKTSSKNYDFTVFLIICNFRVFGSQFLLKVIIQRSITISVFYAQNFRKHFYFP